MASAGKALSDPEAISAWLGELDLQFEKVGLEIGGLSRWLCVELRRWAFKPFALIHAGFAE